MTTNAPVSLKNFNLRQTDCRQEVLDVFLSEPHALAHADLEKRVPEHFDRVTIYRTLKTFVDKGLLHKVLDDEGATKYALCRETCHTADHQHHHDHVHFKCTVCGLTNCLDDVRIPALSLPAGYQRQEINLLVQGVCPVCSQAA